MLGLGSSLSHDLMILCLALILGPLVEEVIFRALMFRGIRDGLSGGGILRRRGGWLRLPGWLALLIAVMAAILAIGGLLDENERRDLRELAETIAALIKRKKALPEGSAERALIVRELTVLRYSREDAGGIIEDLGSVRLGGDVPPAASYISKGPASPGVP